ncbi:T-cell differentiation antigen CD6-like [Centropristis striata]|uniref:T-cell differentiation antigen CD6-like n=1 Tax=Centropristis striata TaxID=184440 RepID=UPI0027DF8E39|nr:T-cell differentiation antigen CD6-like [Centropristis striata]
MQLVKCIFIVQLSFLCQALQNSSTQTEPTDVQVTAEGNNTGGIIQEEINSDPYVHRLSGKCSFALKMPENRKSDVVAISADYTDTVVEQICQDLDCGSVYHVNKTSSPPNVTCFNRCVHREGRLQNCSKSVGGNCAVVTEAVCGHQAVRLAGGSDRCAGRVELWRDGRWGTVCDDQWDLRDADVVCAQLGCGYALSVTGQGGSFPPGRGPVYRDELNCTGRERNLWACPAAQNDSDCGHKEDAGVVCSEMRAVRLTGGLDRCSGIVEIHRNGSWGTVCDNCWSESMASMVCSMLQCGAKPKQYTRFLPPLAHNNGTLFYYICDGKMRNLWQCKEYFNNKNLCAYSKASGVICNGSLGFPAATTASTANATVITKWTTESTTPAVQAKGFALPSPELLIAIALALLFLVLLITNTVLCCHYRRKHAFLIQQAHTSQRTPSEHHHNSYQDAVDLIKVTPNPLQAEVPSNPRYLWTQLSSVDSTSVDTDYEQYDPSNDPSVPLSTFRNSQRYRTDVNPLRPSGLDSLFEEVPEPTEPVMGTFEGNDGGPDEPQYARVSKISMDSFDTSSTSSGECYENTNNGYIMVTPEGQSQSCVANAAFDPLRLVLRKDKLHPGQTSNLQNSGDSDSGPIYSPVSPDQDSSSEDDYDDIGS